MSKVFVDASVVLEIILERPRKDVAAQAITGHDGIAYISPLTVYLCYYFCRKAGVEAAELILFMDAFSIAGIDEAVAVRAQERYIQTGAKDFEDCLQAVCAERSGCGSIVTFDKRFAAHSGTKLDVVVLA